IEALLIDQIGRLAVGMYHDMCCSAALGGKGGVDIGMGNMPVAGGIEIQRLGSAAGGPDDGGTGPPVQCEHFAARTVDPARLSVISSEPDGVAGFEFHRLRREGLGRSEEHTSELQSLMRISYA